MFFFLICFSIRSIQSQSKAWFARLEQPPRLSPKLVGGCRPDGMVNFSRSEKGCIHRDLPLNIEWARSSPKGLVQQKMPLFIMKMIQHGNLFSDEPSRGRANHGVPVCLCNGAVSSSANHPNLFS